MPLRIWINGAIAVMEARAGSEEECAMKKAILLGVMGIIIVASLFVFGKRLLPTPKLAIDQETWDFGVVKDMQSRKHRFIIQNRGNAVLTLEAWPSCHKCIYPVLTSNKIPPQGKAELQVELFIVKDGVNEPYVILETNDPAQPLKKVYLKAVAQLGNAL